MNPVKIHIPGHKKHSQIPTELIGYFEGETNNGSSYSYVHYIDFNKPQLVAVTLKYFERLLPGFVRVSRHALVNPAIIDKVISHNGRFKEILLTNGRRLIIPRRRVAPMYEQLKEIGVLNPH